MSLSYDKFLYTHLTKLGDTNIEDGGYYRDYSSSRGERYIYSYIQELTSTKAPIMTKVGELSSTYGLGIGPLFASVFESGTDYIGLTVGYVYPGSPAETAGLRRGDTIYQVGNSRITKNDYQRYMQELFYSPKGTYQLGVARYEINEAAQKYDLDLNNTIEITPAEYGYNPIIFAAIMTNQNIDGDSESNIPAFNIGYMASESFDSSAQEVLEYQIKQFIDAGITELILDLRFNVGGEVQQSRYLASSIVGRDYDDKDFFKAEFNDKRVEPWKFQSGPSESDVLGVAPAMGLKRLWVIMSENTASASELIIHGLKGVDFPVTLIGSRSEGKNVGMVVTQTTYNGRRFEFAPITYWGLNADGEKGPADGFIPQGENLLNNRLGLTTDVVKTGRSADFGSNIMGVGVRKITDLERKTLLRSVDKVYETFTSKVSNGRNLPMAKVLDIAQGRVWSGTRAVELGLADANGGLREAIAVAVDKAGIAENFRVTEVLEELSPMAQVMQQLNMQAKAYLFDAETLEAAEYYNALKRELTREGVQAYCPYVVGVN